MKKSEIKVGGHYQAKVSNNLVTVRVDNIRSVQGFSKSRTQVYDVTNIKTGRNTTFRSAAKFRREALAPVPQSVQELFKL